MHTLVIGAAPASGRTGFYLGLLAAAETVIAADAAGEWCLALGRAPDLVVGDFDSADPGAADRLLTAGVSVEQHPPHKDVTDLDLALERAVHRRPTAITVTRVLGGRVDHTLANLGSLARIADQADIAIHEPDTSAWFLSCDSSTSLALDGAVGTIVSLVALEPVVGLTTTGLRYPLHRARLSPLASLGVSNVLSEPSATVTIEHGTLLVVCADETSSGDDTQQTERPSAVWTAPHAQP